MIYSSTSMLVPKIIFYMPVDKITNKKGGKYHTTTFHW